MPNQPDVLEKLVSLCKRRGYIFQSSEIYGGAGSVLDYGPLGVELKRNLQDRWWHTMVRSRDDIEGLDAAILMHPRVWEASGHVAGFADPPADCRAWQGGGTRWCGRATTSKGSMRPFSCTRACGRRAATWPASPIPSSIAGPARAAFAPINWRP